MSAAHKMTPDEGVLGPVSVPQLLAEAWRDRRSGSLRLAHGKSERRILVVEGSPASIESSRNDDRFASVLEDAGHLTAASRTKVEQFADDRECPQAKAVLALRLVEPKTLYRAIRDNARNQIAETFGWATGAYQWTPADAVAIENAKPFDLLALLQAQLPKRWGADRLFQALMAVSDCHGDIAPRFRRVARKLAQGGAPAERAIARLDGTAPLGQVLGECAGDPMAAATLWTLLHTGILRIGDARAKNTVPMSLEFELEVVDRVQAADSAAASAGETRVAAEQEISPKAQALSEEIDTLLAHLSDVDHYSALGLTRDANAVDIRKAYFKAAKRYHPDALAKLGLGDRKEEAARVFARIAEAFETLSNMEKRAIYDKADNEEPEIDMARLTQAETSFRKGEILIRMGNFDGALEYLEPAVDLWPDEPAYQGALGWALYKQPKSDWVRARAHLEIAASQAPEDAVVLVRLSHVLRSLGETAKSAELLARAREIDPSVRE